MICTRTDLFNLQAEAESEACLKAFCSNRAAAACSIPTAGAGSRLAVESLAMVALLWWRGWSSLSCCSSKKLC